MTIKTPIGYGGQSLDLPVLDTAAAQSVALTADVDATIPLAPGVYYVIHGGDFEFTHGSGDTSAYVRLPWFANTYMPLFLDKAQDLVVMSATAGDLKIVPAASH